MGFFDFFKGKKKSGVAADKEGPVENGGDSGASEQEEQAQSSEDTSDSSGEQPNQ